MATPACCGRRRADGYTVNDVLVLRTAVSYARRKRPLAPKGSAKIRAKDFVSGTICGVTAFGHATQHEVTCSLWKSLAYE